VAARGTRQILVEVKSFVGRSFVADLQAAIGQYSMYQNVIDEQGLGFRLYLAISSTIRQFKSEVQPILTYQKRILPMGYDSQVTFAVDD
jgi:hypothetical protein